MHVQSRIKQLFVSFCLFLCHSAPKLPNRRICSSMCICRGIKRSESVYKVPLTHQFYSFSSFSEALHNSSKTQERICTYKGGMRGTAKDVSQTYSTHRMRVWISRLSTLATRKEASLLGQGNVVRIAMDFLRSGCLYSHSS